MDSSDASRRDMAGKTILPVWSLCRILQAILVHDASALGAKRAHVFWVTSILPVAVLWLACAVQLSIYIPCGIRASARVSCLDCFPAPVLSTSWGSYANPRHTRMLSAVAFALRNSKHVTLRWGRCFHDRGDESHHSQRLVPGSSGRGLILSSRVFLCKKRGIGDVPYKVAEKQGCRSFRGQSSSHERWANEDV